MMKKLKNIKPSILLVQMLLTLAYPAIKAFTAENNRLQVFTDVLTIIALLLLFFGVFYSLYLHGDFDLGGYFILRQVRKESKKDYQAYKEDKKEEREAAFNYPLFLGLVYFAVSAIIAYGVL